MPKQESWQGSSTVTSWTRVREVFWALSRLSSNQDLLPVRCLFFSIMYFILDRLIKKKKNKRRSGILTFLVFSTGQYASPTIRHQSWRSLFLMCVCNPGVLSFVWIIHKILFMTPCLCYQCCTVLSAGQSWRNCNVWFESLPHWEVFLCFMWSVGCIHCVDSSMSPRINVYNVYSGNIIVFIVILVYVFLTAVSERIMIPGKIWNKY